MERFLQKKKPFPCLGDVHTCHAAPEKQRGLAARLRAQRKAKVIEVLQAVTVNSELWTIANRGSEMFKQ